MNYPITEADDLYDQDILTDCKCPICNAQIVSHPDCTESCSNELCEWKSKGDTNAING